MFSCLASLLVAALDHVTELADGHEFSFNNMTDGREQNAKKTTHAN